MNEKPDAQTLEVLRDAMAALSPSDLTKFASAIKAASKTNQTNIVTVEKVLREMGDSLVVSDAKSAETFFFLSETLAVAREDYENVAELPICRSNHTFLRFRHPHAQRKGRIRPAAIEASRAS